MDRRELTSLFHPHRLPREAFTGTGTVFFTCCLADRQPVLCGAVADRCTSVLHTVLPRHATRGDAFCLMPDHVHILMTGMLETSDVWQAIVEFKQQTGRWFWRQGLGIRWQRGFDARLMQPHRSLDQVVAYIRNNPVRRGLVQDWREHPYTGEVPWESWRYKL